MGSVFCDEGMCVRLVARDSQSRCVCVLGCMSGSLPACCPWVDAPWGTCACVRARRCWCSVCVDVLYVGVDVPRWCRGHKWRWAMCLACVGGCAALRPLVPAFPPASHHPPMCRHGGHFQRYVGPPRDQFVPVEQFDKLEAGPGTPTEGGAPAAHRVNRRASKLYVCDSHMGVQGCVASAMSFPSCQSGLLFVGFSLVWAPRMFMGGFRGRGHGCVSFRALVS